MTFTHITLRIPQFSTIERFLFVGGGEADDIYDRMMEIAYPKGSNVVLNKMTELKNKATQNLKAIRTIASFNGLFGLHDCIFDKKYKGTSDLIFGVNGLFDLHDIISLPTTSEKLLQIGEERTFNFFESISHVHQNRSRKWSSSSISILENTKSPNQVGRSYG